MYHLNYIVIFLGWNQCLNSAVVVPVASRSHLWDKQYNNLTQYLNSAIT